MKSVKNSLLQLIATAKALGLDENSLDNARDYLKHNETGLSFDTILTQLYEYNVEIDSHFYETISAIAEKMNLRQDTYSFMKELIKNETSSK